MTLLLLVLLGRRLCPPFLLPHADSSPWAKSPLGDVLPMGTASDAPPLELTMRATDSIPNTMAMLAAAPPVGPPHADLDGIGHGPNHGLGQKDNPGLGLGPGRTRNDNLMLPPGSFRAVLPSPGISPQNPRMACAQGSETRTRALRSLGRPAAIPRSMPPFFHTGGNIDGPLTQPSTFSYVPLTTNTGRLT